MVAMENLGYSVVNVGERDLRQGYEALVENLGERKFALVSANVVRNDTKQTVFEPYAIVEAVAFHHHPLRAGGAMANEVAAVHLADAFFWDECRERPKPPLPTGGSLDMDFVAKLGVDDALPELRQLEAISMI